MALTTVRSTGIGSLPAISGANLTSLTAGNLTGTLPAISGANLTGISSGKIVKTAMTGNINFSGDVSTNSDSFQYFGNELAFTPTSSSNALIFHMHLSDVFTSSKNIDITIYDKTNSTYVTGASGRMSTFYSQDDANIPVTLMYILETAGSGARTYQGQFKRRSGSGHVYINNGGSNGFCRFSIMEVVDG